MQEIRTPRLLLRRWQDRDLSPFAELNADPEVMAWLGSGAMDAARTLAYIERCEAHFDDHGFGLWAVERLEDGVLIGACGLLHFSVDGHPMSPAVEAAWRQRRDMWGNGYMAEAAGAALADGFGRIALEEVMAWTSASNQRSQAVMLRVGMTRREALDFDAPALPGDHPLRRHVVFGLVRNAA